MTEETLLPGGLSLRGPLPADETGSTSRYESAATWLAYLSVAAPFAIALGRILAVTRHVYLSDDLALIDFNVRAALHFRASLGPFDRFGWSHPGPAEFYLLSIPARLLGPGARAEFAGATLVNALAAIGTIAVVRRRSGAWASLFSAGCLGVLAITMGSAAAGAVTYSEGPLGALVTPWNPDIVIFPLVLCLVLGASAAAGSGLSLVGAFLVGSFAVQTNVATLPLVAVVVGGGALAWLIAAFVARRRLDSERAGTRRRRPGLIIMGLVVLVLMWVPPITQQIGGHPGNMTLMWRFFTNSHPNGALVNGLWSVLSVDGVLMYGLPQEMSYVLGAPHEGAHLVLGLVLAVGLAAVIVGAIRRAPFPAALGAAGLIASAVSVEAATRIVGPTFAYLIIWEVAVPIAGLIGLGAALFGSVMSPRAERAGRVVWASRAQSWVFPMLRRGRAVLVSLLAVAVAVAFSVEALRLPSLARVSDPEVAAAWHDVAPHLSHRGGVFLDVEGVSLDGLFTFIGLFDELQARGFHPRVRAQWTTEVGPSYVSTGHEQVRIILYGPSTAVEKLRGYVGHTPSADVVITGG